MSYPLKLSLSAISGTHGHSRILLDIACTADLTIYR